MIEHIKMMVPYLDTLSMLLTGQVPHRSNSQCHLFRNLKDPMLLQTLSYRRKITYHLLLIGFLHKLISMKDVGIIFCIYMQLNSCHRSTCTSELSLLPNDNDAELNRQFPFGINLNKILPDLLKLGTKQRILPYSFHNIHK